jgi:hypothetical protein
MRTHVPAPPARAASVARGIAYAVAALSGTVACGLLALGGATMALALGAAGAAVGLAAASTSPGLGRGDAGALTFVAVVLLAFGALALAMGDV